jgi:hypothetical protein
MSMLVLHPRISISTACTGRGVDVSVGRASVGVGEGGGVYVLVGVDGIITVTVFSNDGGGMISGVAVTMPGVHVGIGVQTGNGWGAAPHTSQAESVIVTSRRVKIFLIQRLYPRNPR